METSILSGMCRCCALEGTFKDLKCTYHWMGEQEVYGDMLRECFNIDLSAEDGIDGGICEVCITQLRNAANFKKQVLYTEDQFKKRLQNKFFKASLVKVELPADDGPDSDDNENNLSEDEAFSNIEYEVPIKKEELDEPKPKKRAAKATTSRAKKAKADVGETSKRKQRKADATNETVIDVKKSENKGKPETELQKTMHNARLILKYTTATPIRKHDGMKYNCWFCPEKYEMPSILKQHTIEEHKEKILKTSYHNNVKLDITGMSCKICKRNLPTLEEGHRHLIYHGQKIFTDIKNCIIPFKFDKDELKCVSCDRTFQKFKVLLEHMNTHFMNYTCDICGSGFVNNRQYAVHFRNHKTGTFPCGMCSKIFTTAARRRYHKSAVHGVNKLNKCAFCEQRFTNCESKERHQVKVHGVKMLEYKCKACDNVYYSRNSLNCHVKKAHLLERNFICDCCDMRFFTKAELVNHKVKHTGEKKFVCVVCTKAYPRKKTLREHMRIHQDDRRFKCDLCGYAFVQKCSLLGHMKSKHSEVL